MHTFYYVFGYGACHRTQSPIGDRIATGSLVHKSSRMKVNHLSIQYLFFIIYVSNVYVLLSKHITYDIKYGIV